MLIRLIIFEVHFHAKFVWIEDRHILLAPVAPCNSNTFLNDISWFTKIYSFSLNNISWAPTASVTPEDILWFICWQGTLWCGFYWYSLWIRHVSNRTSEGCIFRSRSTRTNHSRSTICRPLQIPDVFLPLHLAVKLFASCYRTSSRADIMEAAS